MERTIRGYGTELIPVDAINVGERHRKLRPETVEALALSIAELGLRTPLTVRADPTQDTSEAGFDLIAGHHRLEALRQLGEEDAVCFVVRGDAEEAKLWELDENFARAELTDAQRAEHHVRREAILVRRGQAATPGRGGDRSNGQDVRSYAQQAASSLGVTERTVRRDLRRGKAIAADVLAKISGSDFDKGVVLDELASTPRAEQPARLAEIAQRREAPSPPTDTIAGEEAARIVLRALGPGSLKLLVDRLRPLSMSAFVTALERGAITAEPAKAA